MRGWICLLAVCLLAACADSDDKERWVMKEIPHDGADYMAMGIYRGRDLDSIGFAPFGEGVVRGYYVRSSEADAPWEARTMLRCVGYDGEGNTVGCYYPVGKVENLKWRYFRVYE